MIGQDVADIPRGVFNFGHDMAVYRLYDASEVLLYVGIGFLEGRLSAHRAKDWWPKVAHRTVAWHRSRIEALSVEALAIHAENPVHNIRKDRPLPVVRGDSVRDWLHMVPESTLCWRMDYTVREISKHGLHIGIAERVTRRCLGVIVPTDWYGSIMGGNYMDTPQRREVRTDELKRELRPLLNAVEREHEHVIIKRYDEAVAVLVPVGWYEQAQTALTDAQRGV